MDSLEGAKPDGLNMETTILNSIPCEIDFISLAKKVRVELKTSYADSLEHLVNEGSAIVNPKVLYRTAYLHEKDEEDVVINGVRLKSRVLSVNLENVYRVFPFVATCGTELEMWAKSQKEMILRFWAETIMETALYAAIEFALKHIDEHHQPGKTAIMSPGSIEDWPIEEQSSLFSILGDVQTSIGVQINQELMMTPEHSVSGIIFPTEYDFETCQLCPREICPSRRASFDKDLYKRRYLKNNT
jgi:hypothetical protein